MLAQAAKDAEADAFTTAAWGERRIFRMRPRIPAKGRSLKLLVRSFFRWRHFYKCARGQPKKASSPSTGGSGGSLKKDSLACCHRCQFGIGTLTRMTLVLPCVLHCT